MIETYKRKGITFDDNTLYKEESSKINIKPIFKESKDMPILEDFYNVISEDESLNYLKNKMYPFINGSLKFLNNYTNIELDNKLIVADIHELGEDNIKYGMYLFIDIFWDKIKKNRLEKKAIYMDGIIDIIFMISSFLRVKPEMVNTIGVGVFRKSY